MSWHRGELGRESFANRIGQVASQSGSQMTSCECILASIRRVPVCPKKKDERAGNISEMNSLCMLEDCHVKSPLKNIVVKRSWWKTYDRRTCEGLRYYVLWLTCKNKQLQNGCADDREVIHARPAFLLISWTSRFESLITFLLLNFMFYYNCNPQSGSTTGFHNECNLRRDERHFAVRLRKQCLHGLMNVKNK